MIELTGSLLHSMFLKAPPGRVDAFLAPFQDMCQRAELTTANRVVACFAQIAHETGELRWLEEIWGPTDAQKKYEWRKDLGNVSKGDGYRYRGRGIFQLTGRSNYRLMERIIGLPLEANPDLASQPGPACTIAAEYWTRYRLNELADKRDTVGITRRINGGLNNLVDRERYVKLYTLLLKENHGT